MPIVFKIDRPRDLTIFTGTGDVSYDDLINALASYDKAGPTRYEIFDFRKFTGEPVNFMEIRHLVEKGKKRPFGWQTAVVVSRNTDLFLGRIFQGMTEVETTHQVAKIFQSIEDAYEWLDIPPVCA